MKLRLQYYFIREFDFFDSLNCIPKKKIFITGKKLITPGYHDSFAVSTGTKIKIRSHQERFTIFERNL